MVVSFQIATTVFINCIPIESKRKSKSNQSKNNDTTTMADLSDCLNAVLNKSYSVINDVTLIGSDGVHLPACRALLAVRSKHFQRIFYGQRTKVHSYQFSFPSSVVQAFVKYCYTDSVDRPCNFNDETAIALVQLQIIGEQSGVNKLHEDVMNIFGIQLRAHPGCICAVMEELMNRGCINNAIGPTNNYTGLWELCFEQIDEKPIESLLPEDSCISGIRGRSFRLFETIFRGMGKLLDPMIAVKVLKEWNRTSGQTMTGNERAKLQKLADSLDLSCLSHTDIARFEPCDLFSKDRIDTAHMSVITREHGFRSKRDERDSKPAPSAARKGFLDLPPSAGNDGTQRKKNGLADNLQHGNKDKRTANTNAAVSLPSDPGYVQRRLQDLKRIVARNSQLAPAPPFGKRKETPNNLVKSPAQRHPKKMKTQAKPNDFIAAESGTKEKNIAVAESEAAIANQGEGDIFKVKLHSVRILFVAS